MKKSMVRIVCIALILFLFAAIPAFSQKVEEADVYYVNVQILKIFAHQKGYYVIYRRSGLKSGEVFIPHEWLEASDGRAKIEMINTMVNPYLSFYIKNGKFDHIKIAAPRDISSAIWGTLVAPQEYNSRFEGVETLELKF